MTDYNSVVNQLVAITGCDEQSLDAYRACINSAISYVNSILIDEENSNDIRIINLCAVNAAVKIALIKEMNNEDIVSFSAGDVSFTKGASPVDRLRLLEGLALNECAVLIIDSGFSFKAV